ncbi:hypothetical protein QJS04_geneDACA000604 [Acorus gramineus]|uniref:Amino acid transporter transmembrane domain-containing protein n=1 Tax=Acorus gramineus TaxID=55184 RepID=A0AAV9AP28_ACOGR|nr:hypothetical protein QJS04_geneDACA000604 [Acorus gramineus]
MAVQSSLKHAHEGWSIDEPLILHIHEDDSHSRDTGGTTFSRTCFNGINALSGVGILSIPYALAQGGWLSLVLLFVMAIICCYTGLLLQRCMDANPRIRSYPDVGEHAFGYKGRVVIALFLYLELYLVSIGFLILEGDNLENLLPGTSFVFLGLNITGKQFFVLIATLLILPTTWLRNLSLLAYVSAGGVLASVVMVLCVFWVGALGGIGFHEGGRLLNLKGLSTSMSLYAFCYSGHAVFPTLYTSMKTKSQFPKALLTCFVLCFINYGTMAVLGYLMFGDNVNSQVTLNLPVGNLGSKIAIYTTLINPFTKYALMVTPIATAIEERLSCRNVSASLIIRTLIVISTVIVALAVPLFGYLMALIGSFLCVAASMLIPCICYLKIFESSRHFGFELLTILGILVLGFVIAVVGTYSSLQQIVHNL